MSGQARFKKDPEGGPGRLKGCHMLHYATIKILCFT